MDIEVALAFAKFDGAPQEVADTAQKFSDNFINLKKAQAQVDSWNAQKRAAQALHDELLKAFKDAIDRWDPAKLNDLTAVSAATVTSVKS